MFHKKNTEVPVDLIRMNPDQPRKVFNESDMLELADSIREYGVLQPIIVSRDKEGQYFLIAGERRLRASKMAGLSRVPVIIKEVDARDIALIALVENVQRENLSYLEEAIAYKKLMEDFGLSQMELSKRVGKQQSTISNKIRLLALPKDIQEILISNQLTERHARALLKLEDEDLRKRVLDRVVDNNLNVKQTERLIEDVLSKKQEEMRKAHKLRYINYKIYINSIRKTFDQIKDAESNAKYYQQDLGDMLEIKILIPKNSTCDKVS
ncbi:ParB/RepB/Spo0J family partition protein [Aminipila butyrica]|uniref:ParB/RepB/Spo0J family partition protein n=1 Tax=Aminipila butyrica TaxID=433296 RepID=A0A858BRH3_9FIRM|nr:ParB/RepB/Spo0J family partition protein [Aminipila butyrica]QIB67922.1 ParB/RepB/Spo0J family partition protein [Aminipila butyrica]